MLPNFPSPRARHIWVKAELENRGSSFAAIASELGCNRVNVQNAMSLPLDAQEKAIAAKLGVTQQELFPERFDAQGKRLHPVKNSRRRRTHNVKNQAVA